MKRSIRFLAIGLCVAMFGSIFAGCNTKKMTIGLDMVDIYAIGGMHTAKQDDNGRIKIDVTQSTSDVQFNLQRFFAQHPGFIGKGFYFTRNDVTKGDGTLIKGSAWVQVSDEGTRLFKKLGYENDTETQSLTKSQIERLPEKQGTIRMYILKDGKHTVYLDSTTESNMKPGKTPVRFRFHGHHGRVAQLEVEVTKPQPAPPPPQGTEPAPEETYSEQYPDEPII